MMEFSEQSEMARNLRRYVCESQGFHQADAPGDYCVRDRNCLG